MSKQVSGKFDLNRTVHYTVYHSRSNNSVEISGRVAYRTSDKVRHSFNIYLQRLTNGKWETVGTRTNVPGAGLGDPYYGVTFTNVRKSSASMRVRLKIVSEGKTYYQNTRTFRHQ
ncbi:hypothetical protein NSQ26_05970 [Bacillus sp. FSL W7-1360]